MFTWLSQLSRSSKRFIMIVCDAGLVLFCTWAAFAIRMGEWVPVQFQSMWWILIVMPLVSIPIFASCMLYRSVIRYLGPRFSISLLQGVTISAIAMALVAFVTQATLFPRTVPLIFWMLTIMLVGGSRLLVRWYFRQSLQSQSVPVLIYGGGDAGAGLVSAIVNSGEYMPMGIIDDDPELWGDNIRGVKVYSPDRLDQLLELGTRDIFLALPSVSRSRRLEIIDRLRDYEVRVSTIPNLEELVAGSARYDEIRPILIEDLLGREPVKPDAELLGGCTRAKSVLVTGAGGSIGSELCRQIIRLGPIRLVLVDQSEIALYEIENELRSVVKKHSIEIDIVALLGDVCDSAYMGKIIGLFEIQTIYHAAAYKHVPIVEQNLVQGVRNNILGTWSVASAAIENRVTSFVLISTDKAVRPTNVMGATKRLAELILQGLAKKQSTTCFCMVRFGNVLDSSGSVVPLFREQIQAGGPVTVTHSSVIRYFMTIPEAAQLVIQAGSLARGGDVFVLDMGEPVKIIDLARSMIRLAGRSERTNDNPDGDIEIEITGLRPGEKLYEELLIGQNTVGTSHKQILRANEDDLPWDVIESLIQELTASCEDMECDLIRRRMESFVDGYNPAMDIVDRLWLRREQIEGGETLSFHRSRIESEIRERTHRPDAGESAS